MTYEVGGGVMKTGHMHVMATNMTKAAFQNRDFYKLLLAFTNYRLALWEENQDRPLCSYCGERCESVDACSGWPFGR